MQSNRLPATYPWLMAFVAHTPDRVIVHLTSIAWECLTPEEDYVLDCASFDADITNGGGIAYYVRPERWVRLCSLLTAAAVDPAQAIFDAWIDWAETNELPPRGKRAACSCFQRAAVSRHTNRR